MTEIFLWAYLVLGLLFVGWLILPVIVIRLINSRTHWIKSDKLKVFSRWWIVIDLFVTIPLLFKLSGDSNSLLYDDIILTWTNGFIALGLANLFRVFIFFPLFISKDQRVAQKLSVLACFFFVPIFVFWACTIPFRVVNEDKFEGFKKDVLFKGVDYQVYEKGGIYAKFPGEKNWRKVKPISLRSPVLLVSYGHLYVVGDLYESGFIGYRLKTRGFEVLPTDLKEIPEKLLRDLLTEERQKIPLR